MKAKLGVSVGLLGAAIFLAALFGGFTPTILLVGYVLLFEENEWLKKSAVKAVAILIIFAFFTTLINLIPDLLYWVSTLVSVFKGNFNYSTISLIISFITQAIEIIRTCLFLLLGLKALSQGTVAVPVVDKLIGKYM